MSAHKPNFTYHEPTKKGEAREHKVSCTACGEASEWLPQKWQAEDWWRKHTEKIERIKANLGSRNPSLASQQRYYQQRADDDHLDRETRDMWQILADGLAHRLNAQGADDQPMLPGMP